MELIRSIEETEKEFQFLKLMVIGKLNGKELDEDCLERVMDHVYWQGHYVGQCRNKQFPSV